MPKSRTTFNSKIETYLAAADLDRFLSVCRCQCKIVEWNHSSIRRAQSSSLIRQEIPTIQ